MKILAAVDGSPYTKRMLAYLSVHDEWLGAHHQYTLIHAVPAVPVRAAAVIDRATLKSYYEAEGEKVFKPIRAFFEKRKMSAEFVSKVGNAAELISQVAKAGHFDLLIMGSHGHGTLTNLVMGSVSTKVLSQCDTPVLLVR